MQRAQRAVEFKVEIGKRLARAKAILPRGAFVPWAEKQFGWSRMHVWNHLKLARKAKRVLHLRPEASLRAALASIRESDGAQVKAQEAPQAGYRLVLVWPDRQETSLALRAGVAEDSAPQRSLPPIGFRDPNSPRRWRAIGPTMNSPVQVAESHLQACPILPPRHSVHSPPGHPLGPPPAVSRSCSAVSQVLRRRTTPRRRAWWTYRSSLSPPGLPPFGRGRQRMISVLAGPEGTPFLCVHGVFDSCRARHARAIAHRSVAFRTG